MLRKFMLSDSMKKNLRDWKNLKEIKHKDYVKSSYLTKEGRKEAVTRNP